MSCSVKNVQNGRVHQISMGFIIDKLNWTGRSWLYFKCFEETSVETSLKSYDNTCKPYKNNPKVSSC